MAQRRVKRQYHSPARAAAAEGTRAAILAAARRLFAAGGFAATPIESIAREAGVAVQTVYAVFGTKRAVLESLLDDLDHQADPGAYRRAMDSGSPAQQRKEVVRFLSRLFTRGSDLINAARAAGAGDPALRDLARKGLARHRRGVREIVREWSRAGVLREGLGATDAEDTLNAITSYAIFAELRDAGWSARRYERWLDDAITRLVLARR